MADVSPTPAARDPRATHASARTRRRFDALISLLHRVAESGWSRSAVLAWGFINGAIVPGPSDALLVGLGLAHPTRVYAFAWWGTVGAALGGFVAYAIGAFAFTQVGIPLLGLFGVTPDALASLHAWFASKGWIVVVLGSLPLASPKVVSIAAGGFGVPFLSFGLALSATRLVRFMIEATILYFAGSRLISWVEKKLGRPLIPAR
ncbi:MAG TPA: hypothetical protein VF166_08300 [Gemmatimonadaceae bacterium]